MKSDFRNIIAEKEEVGEVEGKCSVERGRIRKWTPIDLDDQLSGSEHLNLPSQQDIYLLSSQLSMEEVWKR